MHNVWEGDEWHEGGDLRTGDWDIASVKLIIARRRTWAGEFCKNDEWDRAFAPYDWWEEQSEWRFRG